ncbi:alpha/beta fold hydrolase [Mycoplasma sp. ATU-Cv-508]|uniref:alpha/beta fold hydrolase n=1 Tax=Mycoplasma sp. ATU-Cv-508 TaxID=2048001 RepID=UPI000FDF148C
MDGDFCPRFNSSSDFAKPVFGLKTNYNIISVNLPGSRYLDHDEAELGIDFYVKLLEIFIKNNVKSRKIVLVGHSLGGGIVAALSKLSKVKRVVYVAAINPHMIYARNWTALYDLFFGQGIHKSLKNMLVKAGAKIYKSLVDKNAVVKEICDQQGRFVPIIKNYLLNTEYMSEILKDQYRQSLRKTPLFIIGDQDRIVETSRFVNFVEQELGQKVVVLPELSTTPF